MRGTLDRKKDPLGHAVKDYHASGNPQNIEVWSDIAEDDVIPVSWLFRGRNEMPVLERRALELCTGRILDVGAAAGCHSLLLQEAGRDVTALEYSAWCCEVMRSRGVKKVQAANYYVFEDEPFDTLLCLMNGIGIAGTLSGLGRFLAKASALLTSGGRIIFDSSDVGYLYEEEDGSRWVDLNAPYFGEMKYRMKYKDIEGDVFPWLFVDTETLAPIAAEHGFSTDQFAQGTHYDYLGILTKRS